MCSASIPPRSHILNHPSYFRTLPIPLFLSPHFKTGHHTLGSQSSYANPPPQYSLSSIWSLLVSSRRPLPCHDTYCFLCEIFSQYHHRATVLQPLMALNLVLLGYDLNVKCSSQAFVFEPLPPSRQRCLGMLWNLWDTGPRPLEATLDGYSLALTQRADSRLVWPLHKKLGHMLLSSWTPPGLALCDGLKLWTNISTFSMTRFC